MDASSTSIKEKWPLDGNLLEGEEMLAVHPSIKPENQSFVTEKGKNSRRMETSLKEKGRDASYPSIKPENQSFVKEK